MTNNVVILAGGSGKRMMADIPKPMCKVLNKPMLQWVIDACENSDIKNICIVKGFKAEVIDEYVNGKYITVLQAERLGTGHAVMQAEEFLKANTNGNTLILCGDAPFIDTDTIRNSLSFHTRNNNSVTVVTAKIDNPTGYGRIIRTENGISKIVEQKDANEDELLINEVNSGAFWFKTDKLLEVLSEIKPNNSQGEYYLTDTISILISKGEKADAYVSENKNVVLGANDRKGLLSLTNIAREIEIDKHLANGVEFVCTDGVTIENGVEIGIGTTIFQGTILRGKTKIGENCVIGPNCIIENTTVGNGTILNSVQSYDAEIQNNVKIGPFVHIRPNSVIRDGVKIGDFVEVKNSTIDEKTSISHLTYVGDSDVGKRVNFGCGCTTANFDGGKKARTTIMDDAFIGCNTNLIAPVTIGEGAYTAAGSTITKNVPDGALAIERTTQIIKEGYAKRKLTRKK